MTDNTSGPYSAETEVKFLTSCLVTLLNKIIVSHPEAKDYILDFERITNKEPSAKRSTRLLDLFNQILSVIDTPKSETNHIHQILLLIKKLNLTSSHKLYDEIKELEEIEADETLIMDNSVVRSLFFDILSEALSSKELFERIESQKNEHGTRIRMIETIPPEVVQIVNKILSNIDIPAEFEDEAHELLMTLNPQLSYKDLTKVLNKTDEIISSSKNQDKKDLERYISQVNQNIDSMQYFVDFVKDISGKEEAQSLKLENLLRTKVSDLMKSIDDTDPSEESKAIIHGKLYRFITQLDNIRDTEAEKIQNAEKIVQSLTKQLADTHAETKLLKDRLNEQRTLAQKDALTGLPNRTAYQYAFSKALSSAQQSRTPVILAVGDIDSFKAINDTYGHLAGDIVLTKISKILRNGVKDLDFVARYGGEEFVIIFNDCTKETAINAIERIRHKFENTVLKYKEDTIKLTISFGLSKVENYDTAETAFDRADTAMYKAKSLGKNCTYYDDTKDDSPI